jgi:hypothetical protein
MIDRVLLILTGKPKDGEYDLTLHDARDYSPRFFSGLLTSAHQHVQTRKGKIRYDLIVPPTGDDEEGLTLIDREGFFPTEFMQEIIAKVHTGAIQFRHVDIEPKPKLRKRRKR